MLFRTLACASVSLLFTTPSDANTLYVAGNGTGGACTVAVPCPTIVTALNAAAVGDTIVCVSPPLAVSMTITKSITIDCFGAGAPVRDDGAIVGGNVVGVAINIPVGAADPSRTVRLRGMDIAGFTLGRTFLQRGIDIVAATAVYIEDCIISDVTQQGIMDERTGGQTKLFITNSTISNNGGAGIVAAAGATGIVVLDNVRSENNTYGIAVAAGNNVLVNRSVLSGNSVAGIEADGGAQVVVNNSAMSHNTIGVQSASSIRLSNNDIAFNNTAVSGSSGTFGNNRFSGNGSIGTAPTALGGASSDLGQQ